MKAAKAERSPTNTSGGIYTPVFSRNFILRCTLHEVYMAHGANVEDIAYFYPRDAMLARVKSDRNVSVGPSVRH